MSKKIFHERKDCPICGNTRNRELLSRRFDHPSVHGFLSKYYKDAKYIKELDSYDFTVLECPRCSFIWQKFILDDKHMFELYEKLISGAESLEKKKKASFLFFESYAREMRFISRYLKKSPYLVSVLDYGMGWGYWSLMSKAFGFKVHWVEI